MTTVKLVLRVFGPTCPTTVESKGSDTNRLLRRTTVPNRATAPALPSRTGIRTGPTHTHTHTGVPAADPSLSERLRPLVHSSTHHHHQILRHHHARRPRRWRPTRRPRRRPTTWTRRPQSPRSHRPSSARSRSRATCAPKRSACGRRASRGANSSARSLGPVRRTTGVRGRRTEGRSFPFRHGLQLAGAQRRADLLLKFSIR